MQEGMKFIKQIHNFLQILQLLKQLSEKKCDTNSLGNCVLILVNFLFHLNASKALSNLFSDYFKHARIKQRGNLKITSSS